MASGILGLGTSGSVELNDELLTTLKTAESESILDPITANIEDTEESIEAVDEVEAMLLEFLELVESFDLYTSDTNVFDEVYASTSGSSASFDASDTSSLEPGTINVSITQLAQKDVYQSNTIDDVTAEMDAGTISVIVDGETYEFSTEGKTYEDLVEEMNYTTVMDVTLEQVSDSTYRMVVKSAASGESNALTITQSGLDLGLEDADNHVLTAQNLNAQVDGIDYDLSSNKIALQNGLTITAVDEGDSSITLERDDSSIAEAIESIADKYNDLVDLVNSFTIGDEDDPAVLSDSSTLRSIMSTIKETLLGSYGLDDEENLFKYGFSFDTDGYLTVDSSELADAIANNFDDLKELFVGYAEKEGIGTILNEYVDSLDGIDGLLTTYQERLDERLDDLNDEYEEESDRLDEKYEQMASQFAAYTVIISEMETAFASMQAIIDSDSSD